ncbi:small-conductance mechanosensitive channel [Symbiobacterium terraclitae]|uniref:Small-conductance mechanosensitive channel n=1 Tax=Symbiobacterium terraclitae TaxID=557451 RepID=A0ABS4JSW0_9FIRM|nr:mechanosensitive ion channel family protein [Symbiobacterium terraclitae]MBP2017971.1 small-conductance mechanosensitive channel [Symbiobacterium terraclitae]
MPYWFAALQEAFVHYWVAWAVFAGQLLVTWVVAGLARRVMRWTAGKLVSRSNTTLDDRLVEAGTGPVRWTILALGLRFAMTTLGGAIPAFGPGGLLAVQFGVAGKLVEGLAALTIAALVNALAIAALDWYLTELAARSDAPWSRQLLPTLRKVVTAAIYFLAFSVVLQLFDISISALVATAGVASAAIALASQDTLSNMLGGLVLLIDRPFRVGDVIELTDGRGGTVVEVGLRTTRIRQPDGTALVVPNKDMANTRIINRGQPSSRVAIRQTVSVAYGTDPEPAKRVLLDVMNSHPEVLPDPAPGVWFTQFNSFSLELSMSCWINAGTDRARVTDELNVRILKALQENGIAVPYPTQAIHILQEEGSRGKAVERTAPDADRSGEAVPGDSADHQG